MPKSGKTYSRSGASKSGHAGRSGPTSSKNSSGSVKGRLARGTATAQSTNTGKGSSSRSRIPSKGAGYAGSGGTTPQASPVARAHGHSSFQAKTRATAVRKSKSKLVRAGRGVPGPI